MSEQELREMLKEALERHEPYDDDAPTVRQTRDFEEVGMLTSDTGFVLTLSDGSKFNITVQEARR